MKIMDSAFDLNQSIQKVIKGSDNNLKVWVLGFFSYINTLMFYL